MLHPLKSDRAICLDRFREMKEAGWDIPQVTTIPDGFDNFEGLLVGANRFKQMAHNINVTSEPDDNLCDYIRLADVSEMIERVSTRPPLAALCRHDALKAHWEESLKALPSADQAEGSSSFDRFVDAFQKVSSPSLSRA